jgi:hypothetical protein
MKSLLLAGAIMVATATVCFADYWVVGNRATGKCDIVTSNPVINPYGTPYFGDGPYKSLADAKLARSTIRACPEKDPNAE